MMKTTKHKTFEAIRPTLISFISILKVPLSCHHILKMRTLILSEIIY